MDSSPKAQRYNPEITLTTTSSTPVTYAGSTNISSLVDQLTHIKKVSASSRNLSLDLSSGFVALGLNRAAIFIRSSRFKRRTVRRTRLPVDSLVGTEPAMFSNEKSADAKVTFFLSFRDFGDRDTCHVRRFGQIARAFLKEFFFYINSINSHKATFDYRINQVD